jgi:hypothetical protein
MNDGSVPKFDKLCDVCVNSVEVKLLEHMERECLGTPFVPQRSVRSIFETIMSYQGVFIEGDAEKSLENAAMKIAKC